MFTYFMVVSISVSVGFLVGMILKIQWKVDRECPFPVDKPNAAKALYDAKFYILLTEDDKGEPQAIWNNRNMLKGYCPDVYKYFTHTDDAVNEFNEILKSKT